MADGLGAAHQPAFEGGEPQRLRLATRGEADHVARLQREAGGRQGEGGAVARCPEAVQQRLGAQGHLAAVPRRRQRQARDPAGAAHEPAAGDGGGAVIRRRLGEGDGEFGGKIGGLGAGERDRRRVALLDEIGRREHEGRGGGLPSSMSPAAVSRISTPKARARPSTASRAVIGRSMEKAVQHALDRRRLADRHAIVRQHRGEEVADRGCAESAGEPVAGLPVGAVRPDVAARGKAGQGRASQAQSAIRAGSTMRPP